MEQIRDKSGSGAGAVYGVSKAGADSVSRIDVKAVPAMEVING